MDIDTENYKKREVEPYSIGSMLDFFEAFTEETKKCLKNLYNKALSLRNIVPAIRLNNESNRKLTLLTKTDRYKVRSKTAAFLVNEGLKKYEANNGNIISKMEEIRKLRKDLRNMRITSSGLEKEQKKYLEKTGSGDRTNKEVLLSELHSLSVKTEPAPAFENEKMIKEQILSSEPYSQSIKLTSISADEIEDEVNEKVLLGKAYTQSSMPESMSETEIEDKEGDEILLREAYTQSSMVESMSETEIEDKEGDEILLGEAYTKSTIITSKPERERRVADRDIFAEPTKNIIELDIGDGVWKKANLKDTGFGGIGVLTSSEELSNIKIGEYVLTKFQTDGTGEINDSLTLKGIIRWHFYDKLRNVSAMGIDFGLSGPEKKEALNDLLKRFFKSGISRKEK